MFRFPHLCFLTFSLIFPCVVWAQDAEVPVTVEGRIDLLGTGTDVLVPPLFEDERNTCDPEFWDVMKDRAWMEAQREITQNWNIVPRPDSVMVLGCFNRYLNKLATYGHENFPYDPNESAGQLLPGYWNDLAVQAIRIRFAITLGYTTVEPDTDNAPWLGYELLLSVGGSGGDPALTGGIAPYALLELLVLDQLVDGVTTVGRVTDSANFPAAALACGASAEYDKSVYLEDNFPNIALGGRAIERNIGAPVDPDTSSFNEISAEFDDDVLFNVNNIDACNMMMQVWTRAQCYDFAMESNRFNDPENVVQGTPPAVVYGSLTDDHDGFYSFERYRDVAAADEDFRVRGGQCEPPTDDSIPDIDTSDFACSVLEHGLTFPDFTSFSSFLSTFSALIPPPDGDNPIWDTAYTGSYPDIGVVGAPDEYVDYLQLRGDAVPQTPACAPPVKTGYIVVNSSGAQYEDAFCPTPGCWFNPPASIGPNGTCTQ